jgi:hypothetical protein
MYKYYTLFILLSLQVSNHYKPKYILILKTLKMYIKCKE